MKVKFYSFCRVTWFVFVLVFFSSPILTQAASDTVKPIISGATNKTIYIGSSFNPLTGVTAKDNVDGKLDKKITVSGTVNTSKSGTYKLTYTVSDKAKNKTVVIRTITVVKDSVKPTISGATNKTIYLGTTFNPLTGVTAKDNVDGKLDKKITVSGTVNTSKSGTYKLTYTVSDKANNKTVVIRTITVVKDSVKPIISGATNKTIYIGTTFNSLTGVTAKDNVDGDITKKIQISGSVNTKKAGSYIIIYTVKDKANNAISLTRTIKVVDNVKPVITGIDDVTVGLNTKFDILVGVSAVDNNDGDLTSSIVVSGTVNTSISGVYEVNYKVSDSSGNTVYQSRKITVKKIDVTGVSISAPSRIKTGVTYPLTASIFPTNATNLQISWHSSDESIATIDENGYLKTLTEGIVTITATVDGVSASKTITVSDRPNLYVYKSGSSSINNVIKSLSISALNYESTEIVIEKVEIYENNMLYSTYTSEALKNSGINTSISPYSSWGMSMNFKIGIWANQSKVVLTVKDKSNKTYQFTINI
ncbi:Bacterial Ig-like domain (group 3) [Mycobacteroides abscessus subsp. abscessus]|nr:Bacterial Ig-like domain (group 3) [Mycobacteroides abscessus subsp. abscessus]